MQKKKAIAAVKRAQEVMEGIHKNLKESGHCVDATVAGLLAEDLREVVKDLEKQQWLQ